MHGLVMFYALLGVVAGVGVVASLYTLAQRLSWELELHALKVETRELRAAYERRMVAMRAGEHAEINVDVIEPEADAASGGVAHPAAAA